MLEYLVLVVLIALATIVAVKSFGDQVRIKFLISEATMMSEARVGEGSSPPPGGPGGAGGGESGGSGAAAAEEEENPYVWDASAQRWLDPSTGLFVSFEEAGRFVDDPFAFRDPSLEPARDP